MKKLPVPLIANPEAAGITYLQLADEIMSRWQDAKSARTKAQDKWSQAYALWRNDSIDRNQLRYDAQRETHTSKNWMHSVNTAKTFEVVETLVAYLKAATFPSDEWFEVRAEQPNLGDVLDVVQAAVSYRLTEAKFADALEEFCRHAILYGVATYKISWEADVERQVVRTFDTATATYRDSEKNKTVEKLVVSVPSPFDVWVDSSATGIWVRLHPSRAEFLALCDEGYYTVSPTTKKLYEPKSQTAYQTTDRSSESSRSPGSEEIVEYYGDVVVKGVVWKNVHMVFLGKELIRIADSEYWCGSPYVFLSLMRDLDSPYGLSSLHPNLGMLHVDNVLTNLRLDSLLIHMMGMWEMVEDGIVEKDDTTMYPGKIFRVANKGNMSRLNMGEANFTVGYTEQATLQSTIDRNMGTGPLIGAGQPRRGDRVTAEEIVAVRDSGGNRINLVHTAIESRGTLPLLEKAFQLLQQYQTEELVVSMFNDEAKDMEYLAVPPDVFALPLKLQPIGANFVIETSRNIQNLLQFMDIAARSPEMSGRINYDEVLLEVGKQLRLKHPKRYLREPEQLPPALPPEAVPEPDSFESPLGGEMMDNALQQQLSTDGGAAMLNALGVPTDQETLQQLPQGALNV